MDSELLVGVITILCSTVISVCSLVVGFVERKHTMKYTEHYRERQDVAEIISSYVEVASNGSFQIFCQRASAVKSSESVDSFSNAVQSHQEKINMHTFKVLSILDDDHSKLKEDLIKYKKLTKQCVIRLVDLKAIAALGDNQTTKNLASDSMDRVCDSIEKLCELEEPIQTELQNVLNHYLKRIG